MNQETTPVTASKVRPAQEVRLGAIRAAIWKNNTENGARYSVTFEKLYHDETTWKSTGSFGKEDLLLLAKVADQAHTWILTEGREPAVASGYDAGDQPLAGGSFPKRGR
jgi:hypothetical protein